MAWDVAIIDKFNVGPKRCHVLSCVADGATQLVVTGLDEVDFWTTGQNSVTAGTNQVVYKNVGTTGTAGIYGKMACSGFTSGDVIYFTVYGR